MALQHAKIGGKELYRNIWTKRLMAQVEYKPKNFRVGEIGLQYPTIHTSERVADYLKVDDRVRHRGAEFLPEASRGTFLLGSFGHVRA